MYHGRQRAILSHREKIKRLTLERGRGRSHFAISRRSQSNLSTFLLAEGAEFATVNFEWQETAGPDSGAYLVEAIGRAAKLIRERCLLGHENGPHAAPLHLL